MSGHSKWSTIKRKKEKTDGARAKVFTKIGRELAVAVREGGSADPNQSFFVKSIESIVFFRHLYLNPFDNSIKKSNIFSIIHSFPKKFKSAI